MAWIERRHLKQLSEGKEQFSYRVCWRDPKGRRRYETRVSRAAAEKYKRQIEHSQDVGAYRDPNLGKVTLDEFFRHHMETASNLAPKTRDLYEIQWRVHVEPRLGHLRLNAISKADVKSFLSGLREDGVPEMTVGAVYRLLRSVLSVAVDEKRISANPGRTPRALAARRKGTGPLDLPPGETVQWYQVAQFAGDDLVDGKPLTFLRFWRLAGETGDWHRAFRLAFGIDHEAYVDDAFMDPDHLWN